MKYNFKIILRIIACNLLYISHTEFPVKRTHTINESVSFNLKLLYESWLMLSNYLLKSTFHCMAIK